MKYTLHLLAAILFNTGEEQVGEHKDRENNSWRHGRNVDNRSVGVRWPVCGYQLSYDGIVKRILLHQVTIENSSPMHARQSICFDIYIWHSWSVLLSIRLTVLVTLYRYYTHRPIATYIDGLCQVIGRKGCSRSVIQKRYVKLLVSSDAPLVQLMRIECFAFKDQLGCRHLVRICSESGHLHQGIILVFNKRLNSSYDGVDILVLLRFVETSQYTLVLRCGFKTVLSSMASNLPSRSGSWWSQNSLYWQAFM